MGTLPVKTKPMAAIPGKFRQQNYYEHTVRHENEFSNIRKHIKDNPQKWNLDRENPDA